MIAIIAMMVIAGGLAGRSSGQVRLTPSADVDHALTFAATSDAPGTVDRHQVRLCYSLLAQRLKVPESELPRVLIVHASAEAAHAADIPGDFVWLVDVVHHRNAVFYEFWVVGQPQASIYIRGFYSIIQKHFKLATSEQQRKDTELFVSRFLSSTVSARGAQPVNGDD